LLDKYICSFSHTTENISEQEGTGGLVIFYWKIRNTNFETKVFFNGVSGEE
jgi:hypothetical protein